MSSYRHKLDDGSDVEKESPTSSPSTSSYPPSPGYLEHEPAWARSSDQSLLRRVFAFFENKPSTTNSQGYIRAATRPSQEFGSQDPIYLAGAGDEDRELLRKPAFRKLLIIFCLVLIYGVAYAYAFFDSKLSTESTPEAAHQGTQSSTETTDSLLQNVSYQDSQCPPILQGGADAIICHIELAQRKLDAMLSRQSQTYDQAVQRYVHLYKRQPPPGFQDWYSFAKDNQAVVIDDYGQLEQDLAPLRRISGRVLRQRVQNALKANVFALHHWTFSNGTVTTSAPTDWEIVKAYRDIMSPFLHKLPEFTVLQNWDDYHRVCGPKDGVEDVEETNVFQLKSYGRPDNTYTLLSGCPRNTATTSSLTSDRPSVDICTNSDDWIDKHGIFHAASACFNSTIPVLSSAKVSSYQDILTATWCYGDENYRLWKPDQRDAIPYSEKKPTLYWRGSNTGSRTESKIAYFGHRQRLVMMAQQMKAKAAQLAARVHNGSSVDFTAADMNRLELPQMPTTFTEDQLGALSRLSNDSIDVNFVRLLSCNVDPQWCEDWKAKIPLSPREPLSAAFKNKFLIDLDGNSMSGRFYRFLESNSLVFKQTIFAEWHDDRIVPWMHYVPVSKSMEELPILLDFFANHPKGRELGEKIANASKIWADTTLRKIDLSVYTYRQMLEMANIIGHK